MDFTPDEMAEFGMAAVKPYLDLKNFMKRETWSSANTVCFKRIMESPDKNWVVGLLCLQFRSGVKAFVAELWQCYEGEGAAGLDERWDVGTAIFHDDMDEKLISGVLGYVSDSESIVQNITEFGPAYRALQDSFNKRVGHPALNIEMARVASGEQLESAERAFEQMLAVSASE